MMTRHTATRKGYILNVTQQGAEGFDTTTNTETDPPRAAPDRRRSLIFTIVSFLRVGLFYIDRIYRFKTNFLFVINLTAIHKIAVYGA